MAGVAVTGGARWDAVGHWGYQGWPARGSPAVGDGAFPAAGEGGAAVGQGAAAEVPVAQGDLPAVAAVPPRAFPPETVVELWEERKNCYCTWFWSNVVTFLQEQERAILFEEIMGLNNIHCAKQIRKDSLEHPSRNALCEKHHVLQVFMLLNSLKLFCWERELKLL